MQTSSTAIAQQIRVEIVNAKGPSIIGKITAQKLSLFKLQWSVKTVSDDENLDGIKKQQTFIPSQ